MVTNHTQTEAVHKVLRSKLEEARMKMATLRRQQTEIDLQIEDNARIILSLERSVATLVAAIPPSPPEVPPADGEGYYVKEIDETFDGPNYSAMSEKDEAA